MVPENDPEAIHIRGSVYDGEGEIVDDALVEIWQANRGGRYAHPEDRRRRRPARGGIHRVRALRHRRRGPLRVHHRQARPRAGPRRPDAGASHRRLGLRARAAQAPGNADLLSRRGRGERRRSRPLLDRGRRGAGDPRRDPRGREVCASTSVSRVTARPPSLSSESPVQRPLRPRTHPRGDLRSGLAAGDAGRRGGPRRRGGRGRNDPGRRREGDRRRLRRRRLRRRGDRPRRPRQRQPGGAAGGRAAGEARRRGRRLRPPRRHQPGRDGHRHDAGREPLARR